jgi:death-on-curing protein
MINYIELEDSLVVIRKLGFFVKDIGLLDSALARPRASVFGEDAYPTLSLKAAAMLQSLIKNHALVDGNKRTGWALMVSFLFINNYKHSFSTEDALNLVLSVATDKLSLPEVGKEIESHLVALT